MNKIILNISTAIVLIFFCIVQDKRKGSRFWSYGLTGRLGYRYQKPGGRFIWRIGFTPLLQRERTRLYYDPHAPFNVFTPWGGISVGYSW